MRSIDDMVRNASQLDLTFSDPASTSGHLIPRGYLHKLGLSPEKSFASMNFASSHAASILSVYTGKSDIGTSSSESYNRLMANGKVDSTKFVILWKSDPILTDPFCVKNTLPTELKEKIRIAFLEMPVKDKEAFDQYIQYTYKGDRMKDSLILRAVSDSSFNSLREIARSVKSLNIK
ncbi:MAG: PhnD/SsuA/transferrin family substrate-binding protein [Bacteroidales bacterium]|nr:PhnD/SsuA/transferrin family substrate-binding protein [Bacteroidales bacterium]